MPRIERQSEDAARPLLTQMGLAVALPVLLVLVLVTNVARGVDSVDLPADSQLRELVGRTLLAFDTAVKSKDFTEFRRLTSTALSSQMSADDLRAAFHDFIDRHADLAGIAGALPTWDMPPSLHEKTLRLRGRYPTAPMQVLFTLKFVEEAGDWKVQGIEVKLKRPETQPVETVVPHATTAPAAVAQLSVGQANRLARQTLLLFDDCVKAEDFSALYDASSAAFKSQVSAKRLAGAFKQFTDKHIDLSPIARLDPQNIEPPHVDDLNVLTIHGRYATSPIVLFQARYIQEAGTWKLLGLSVRTEDPVTRPISP